jgi:hypothetical protein
MAKRRKVANYMRDNPNVSREKEAELLNSFWGYRFHGTDLTEVQVADVSKQYRGYGSRPFYITTLHTCRSCGVEFRFSAEEQKLWFEELGFFIDAYPGLLSPLSKRSAKQQSQDASL